MPSGFLGRGIGPTAIARRAAATFDWWTVAGQTCVAAYKAVGQVDLATSYVNLANPGTYDAAPGTAPGLAAGGWVFNGANQFLGTGITPAATWSILVQFSDVTNGGYLFSVAENAYHWSIQPSGAGVVGYVYAGSDQTQAPAMTAGNLGIVGNVGYRNGAADRALSGSPIFSQLLIAYGAVGGTFIACTIAAVGIYSTTLSAADVAALSARMAALA